MNPEFKEEYMRRSKAILVALLLLAVLAVPASASAFSAVSQFGVSDGLLADAGTGQAGYPNELSVLSGVLGQHTNSFVRLSFSWDPNYRSGLDFTKYDPVVQQAWTDGLQVLPEINLSDNGGSHGNGPACSTTTSDCYMDPFNTVECTVPANCSVAALQSAVQAIAEHYGPGSTFAQANSGPGISRYEVWNEPNTLTGHGDTNTGDMPVTEFDQILHAESQGLVAGATDTAHNGGTNWLTSLQVVCCGFGNYSGSGGFHYAQRYFEDMLGVTGNTVWDDITPNVAGTYAQTGVVSVHVYGAGTPPPSPDNCSITGGIDSAAEKCPQWFTDTSDPGWRKYLDNNAPNSTEDPGLGITEGGYSYREVESGTDCSDPKTVPSASDQALYNAWSAQYYQANPSLNMQFLSYYKALDTPSSQSGNCWQSGLASVVGNGAIGDEEWKPWAANLHLFAAPNNTETAFIDDSFTRSASSGFGTLVAPDVPTGSMYTMSGNPLTDDSDNGFKGIMALTSTNQHTARLDGVSANQQDDSVDATITALPPSGKTTSFIMGARRDSSGDYYQARFDVASTGAVTITFKKDVAGITSSIGTSTVTNCTFTTNTLERLKFSLIGDSPTHLSASCFAVSDGIDGTGTGTIASTYSTPFTLEDSDMSLQGAGSNLLAAQATWASGTSTVTTKFDTYKVQPSA